MKTGTHTQVPVPMTTFYPSHRGTDPLCHARVSISITNQTDGVPEALLVVVRGVHIAVRDAHMVRRLRTIVRTCPVADVLIDFSNRSGITPAGSR